MLLAGPAAGTLVADTSGAGLGGGPAPRCWTGRCRWPSCWPGAAWCCAPTCCARGPGGSPRSTEARRYDTRFFAAALPPGQRTRDVGGEAEQVAWTRPAAAIRAARARELFLLPPTAACLAGLAAYPDVTAALGAEHSMRPVIPAVVQVDGALWLTVPGGRGVSRCDRAATTPSTVPVPPARPCVLAPNPGLMTLTEPTRG